MGNAWRENFPGDIRDRKYPRDYPGELSGREEVRGNVQIHMQDHKSLHAAVMICATLQGSTNHNHG